MVTMTSTYPNAPLVEAVFEIRFPGEPAVECRRDEFFDLIRSKYPHVFVPKIQSGQSPPLELYHFRSDDQKHTVMTAINRFAFSSKKYEGFELFKKETLRLLEVFSKKFKIGKLSRTGLRYTNVIPFVREKDNFPLSSYLNVDINLPPAFPKQFEHLDLRFVAKLSSGSITTHIQPLKAQDGNEEGILLDFDFAKDKGLHIKKVEHYLNESHEQTKEMFEQIITDSYLKYIKGESI